MNLRRDRVHQSGTSNLSHSTPKKSAAFQTAPLKTPGDTFPLSTKHSDPNPSSPMKKSKVLELISKKASRTAVGPTEETLKYYEETHKSFKLKTEIGSPRIAQLEDKDKMKTAFTGESHLIYDKNLEKYRDIEKSCDAKRKPEKKETTKKKTKLTEHAQAIQETQLVGFDKYGPDTLNNNIDLEKVREARRVLRRKYANRKNIQKIYSNWDEENAGIITADNVFNMSKKLGLNLNFDEARVLLASANRTSSGSLNLDEFLDLIYNKDDVLNVDLDKLAKNINNAHVVQKEDLGNTNIISQLQGDAKKAREIKRMNQLKLVLKNRIPDIRQAILELDRDRSGYVNNFKFGEALERLRINQNILSSQDIADVFEKFKTDSTKLNYRDFLEHLQDYTFDYDKEYIDLSITPRKAKHANLSPEDFMPKTLDIVDCRNLPLNMVENYYARSKRVGRAIQQFLPNKEALNEYVAKRLNIQDVENGYVSMKEFKGVVKDMFKKFEVKHIDQRDLEGFLSSILYNKHGMTTIKEVGYTIYEEEEKDFMNKVQMKKKGPEPQHEKRFLAQSTDNLRSIKLTPLELDDSPAERSSVLPAINSKRASRNDLLELKKSKSASKNPVLDKDLINVLQGLDDKYFVGTKSFYKVFKDFDVDGDGFVSHQDFAAKLENANLAKKQDIPKILEYLDPQQKGFVDFSEFSQKIKRNMANSGENAADFTTTKSAMNFTKPDFAKAWESVRATRKFIEETRSSFDPSSFKPNDSKLITRSGAHPGWSNTFLNFQSPSNTAMFVSEGERFYKHRLASTMFQADERRKKELIQEGRLEARRANQNIIADRIARQMAVEDSREIAKRNMKSENIARYENTAKLRNVYT